MESIQAWEIAGNVAEKTYHLGKAVVGFVSERLFTCGGWANMIDIGEEKYQEIMEHMSNVVKGEE